MRIACKLPFILFSFYLGILVSGWQWIVLTWRRPRGQVQALGWGVFAAAAVGERNSWAPAVTPGGMETAFRIAIDRREWGWPYQKTPIEARVICARTWPQRLWGKIAHYGSALLVVHIRSVVYIEFVVANGTLAMRWFSLDLKQGVFLKRYLASNLIFECHLFTTFYIRCSRFFQIVLRSLSFLLTYLASFPSFFFQFFFSDFFFNYFWKCLEHPEEKDELVKK